MVKRILIMAAIAISLSSCSGKIMSPLHHSEPDLSMTEGMGLCNIVGITGNAR